MSIVARKYTLNAGLSAIVSPILYGATVLGVWREGLNYTEIGVLSSFTGNKEFKRIVKTGGIVFQEAGSPTGERVFVLIKT